MRLKATVLGELAQIALGDGGCDTELANDGKPRRKLVEDRSGLIMK